MTGTAQTVEMIICDVVCDHGLDVGDISTIEAVITEESRAADITETVSDLLVEKAQREARAESISKAWQGGR